MRQCLLFLTLAANLAAFAGGAKLTNGRKTADEDWDKVVFTNTFEKGALDDMVVRVKCGRDDTVWHKLKNNGDSSRVCWGSSQDHKLYISEKGSSDHFEVVVNLEEDCGSSNSQYYKNVIIKTDQDPNIIFRVTSDCTYIF